ncbi:MAG: Zn-dependent exopeptidase M28 [Spirochaetes bacterium]|nr:Zn-dependent exopeptidase M28 [Spirochaetota bacterium]
MPVISTGFINDWADSHGIRSTVTAPRQVTGHHDTVFNAPGANDNASACAIIIETARIIVGIIVL